MSWVAWWAVVLGGALGYVIYDVWRTIRERRRVAAIYRGYFGGQRDE